MSEQQLTETVVAAARKVLAEGMKKIDHCVGQLNDAQIWWRPNPEITDAPMNSIANLMLHLAGNIRQYIVSDLGGTLDNRNRPLEFSDRSGRPKSEILATLKATISDADAVLARLPRPVGAGRGEGVTNKTLSPGGRGQGEGDASTTVQNPLLATRHIQGHDVNATAALFKCLTHFHGHVQEIIHLTRNQLGNGYKFDFVPKSAEEKSAGKMA